ncbi:MAG: TetR/AcrR family transcriptional regulator [Acidimicrobiales bacterium]
MRQVVLDAAVELLIEHGAGEVTASRVGKETGVARTTIYRHWPDQPSLLLDAVGTLVAPHAPTTITDDLEADLIMVLSNLRTRMVKRAFRQVFAALLGYANQDRTFVAAQQRFANGVLQQIHDVLTAAVDRNELPPTLAVDEACAALAGPLFHQHIMLRARISDDLITSTVRRFLNSTPETPSEPEEPTS